MIFQHCFLVWSVSCFGVILGSLYPCILHHRAQCVHVPLRVLRVRKEDKVRQAGGYWAAPPQKNKKEKKSTREGGGKMPVTLQQTSLRSLDNVDSHTHIHTVASPCSAAECFRGFHCYSLALQTGGVVIYSEGGNEWLRTHVIPPTPHANTIWQHHVSHVKRGGQTGGEQTTWLQSVTGMSAGENTNILIWWCARFCFD